MKFVNVMADGRRLDTLEGVVLPVNEATLPVYENIARQLQDPSARIWRSLRRDGRAGKPTQRPDSDTEIGSCGDIPDGKKLPTEGR